MTKSDYLSLYDYVIDSTKPNQIKRKLNAMIDYLLDNEIDGIKSSTTMKPHEKFMMIGFCEYIKEIFKQTINETKIRKIP